MWIVIAQSETYTQKQTWPSSGFSNVSLAKRRRISDRNNRKCGRKKECTKERTDIPKRWSHWEIERYLSSWICSEVRKKCGISKTRLGIYSEIEENEQRKMDNDEIEWSKEETIVIPSNSMIDRIMWWKSFGNRRKGRPRIIWEEQDLDKIGNKWERPRKLKLEYSTSTNGCCRVVSIPSGMYIRNINWSDKRFTKTV